MPLPEENHINVREIYNLLQLISVVSNKNLLWYCLLIVDYFVFQDITNQF